MTILLQKHHKDAEVELVAIMAGKQALNHQGGYIQYQV